MPRIPRKQLIDPAEVGVFHCISRCVRRAFLCGDDPLSGKNFNHRKGWLQQRIAFLAGQFGIDLLGFAVMSNHLHVILRNRPDVVGGWSDEEVARRWWSLFPLRRDDDGNPAPPEEWELSLVTGNPERLADVRRRLSSVSWFVRCVAEPIARQANREDQCTGRFWEGRFKCQPLLDESALTACLAYVDLNPIRAGIAATLEESRFTSVYERLAALRDSGDEPVSEEAAKLGSASSAPETAAVAEEVCVFQVRHRVISDRAHAREAATRRSPPRAGCLSPLTLSEDAAGGAVPPWRASNTGCLAMELSEYLELLEWTGRQLQQGERGPEKRDEEKQGVIPVDLPPILQRLEISGGAWLDLMTRFHRLFRRAAGRPESLRRHAAKWGRQRSSGITHSQALFG